ncbi:organic cation transporter protein-like [Haliotis rufescens]|uniref:organic cation transporter protein-like n=1 Tax=Haliotis rufescens TaxID=6454 RepID=UPI001EAF92BE|nr:organic cation transporter protein-like [Haliotis rufescens]XP_046345230.1 organic cation transporter protein-like [Haliotis rufescens]
MKFDEILKDVGEFGPYQRRVYFLVCLACITSAFQTLLPVFILDMPSYRCKLLSMPNDTYKIQNPYHASLVNRSVPIETDDQSESYASCRLYDVTNSSTSSDGGNQSQTTCHGWVYDQSTFTSTVITQFDMVCDHASFRSHLNMVGFGGMLAGAVVFGIITDIVGRKLTLLASGVIQMVFGISLAFSPNFIAFAVFRFFTGVAAMSTFMIAFVIGLELVGPSKRTIAGVAIQFFWCFGLFVLALVAYLIRHWKYLQITMSIPSLFFIGYWWLIPESPRWLLSRGRVDEAEIILNKLARANGRSLPKDTMKRVMLEKGPEMKIWHMFTTPVLIVRGIVIFYQWLAINIIYYGLSLNVSNLSGDVFLNFTLSSAVETAAYVMCIFLMEKTGRKKLYCANMLLGGVACIATLFPVIYGDKSHQWITVTLAMVGKFGASAAFAVLYVFSCEIFPTVVRQSGIGVCSIFEGIGGMVAPYVSDLGIIVGGQLAEALPLIVFGVSTISAGLLSLLLPETKDKKLPETIEDAIVFGRKEESNTYTYDPIVSKNTGEVVVDSTL